MMHAARARKGYNRAHPGGRHEPPTHPCGPCPRFRRESLRSKVPRRVAEGPPRPGDRGPELHHPSVHPRTRWPYPLHRHDDIEHEQVVLREAIRLTKKYYANPGRIEISQTLKATNGTTVAGLWDPRKGVIKLQRDQLVDLRTTSHTLLHETVHKVSNALDCTSEFEDALLNVAINMIKEVK